jgi:uncharacterized protein (DUF1330 family)
MPVNPTEAQFAEIRAIAEGGADHPVTMLNLNRYRGRAAYEGDPPGGASADVSGHEAYGRYSEVAMRVLAREGGRVAWYTSTPGTAIGDDSDRYDEVIAVEYASHAAFLRLAFDPEILAALAHRSAGLERAAIIRCDAPPPAG